MAVTFDAALLQYLSGGPAYDFGATTFITAWIKRANNASAMSWMGRGDGGGSAGWRVPSNNTADGAEIRAELIGDSNYAWSSTWNNGQWHQVVYGRYPGAPGAQELWWDGTSLGTLAYGTYTPLATVALMLGARSVAGSPLNYVTGSLAEVAIYNVDIRSALAQLRTGAASGKSPNNIGIAPVHYWPLIANGNAVIGGFNLTANPGGNPPTFDATAHTGLTIQYPGQGSPHNAYAQQ